MPNAARPLFPRALTHVHPQTMAFGMAAVVALGIGYGLLRMPLQVYDCLTSILDAAASPSAWASFRSHLRTDGYFRPLLYAQIKLLFDMAQGHYALTYRLFQAGLIVGLLMLFVRAMHVRSRTALLVVPLALTIFVGMHTFLTYVKELYAVNHFLEMAVLSLVALNLAQSKGGLRVDVAIIATFLLAALTLESGLLVWVVFAAAWLAGATGVSTRTIVILSTLFAGYFVLRLVVFASDMPALSERSAGFLLERLEPAELQARFGENPMPFYFYNVASSVSSVLFSEPRSGVWVLARQILAGEVPPRTYVNVMASLLASATVLAYVIDRLRAGVRWPRTLGDRHVFIFAAVLMANAVISFSYTKDEIVSVAGAFYPLAFFAAAVHFAERLRVRPPSYLLVAALTVLVLACTGAWAIRAVGVHHVMRSQAFVQRNDWAQVEQRFRQEGLSDKYAESIPLLRALRAQALGMPVVNPRFVPRWADRVFDADY